MPPHKKKRTWYECKTDQCTYTTHLISEFRKHTVGHTGTNPFFHVQHVLRVPLNKMLFEISSQDDLPREEWKSSERLISMLTIKGKISHKAAEKIKVSNLGRVLTCQGIKTRGNTMTRCRKYRRACHFKVHQLVWAVWGDRDPNPDEFILHDDSQPLDEEGCVSNAIQHLRLGTQSENMKECWAVGSKAKRRKIQ